MRHLKHRHKLGVKTAHRGALLANLASSLIRHKRIQTTLSKAKALRPFAEKAITLAKKAYASDDPAKKLHYRRQALAEVRDREAVQILFTERVEEFAGRNGGYTRIYKLIPRKGDGADMAIIELIDADDEGYTKPKKKAKGRSKKAPAAKTETTAAAESDTVAEAETAETAEAEEPQSVAEEASPATEEKAAEEEASDETKKA